MATIQLLTIPRRLGNVPSLAESVEGAYILSLISVPIIVVRHVYDRVRPSV